jgi:lipopolysaccharide transport system ATP-binding protein
MVVRLAFAVAVNSNPQILIVDEALSVGDELFQRKCFSRIEAISNSGATILFVSHSATSIVELCDRAVFLHCGELLAIGSPKHIVGRYQKLLYAPPDKHDQLVLEIRNENDKKRLVQAELTGQNVSETFFFSPEIKTTINLDSYDPGLIPTSLISYGPYGATILDPTIYTKSDDRVNNLTRGTTYRYQYRVRFDHPAINVRFGMLIKTISGLELGGGVSASSNHLGLTVVEAETVYSVEFEFCCRLNPGVYFMNAGVSAQVNGYDTYLHRLVDAAMFRVRAEDENLATVIIDFSCAPTFKLIT